MRRPEDSILLRDMLDYARRTETAIEGKTRADLDKDIVLVAALERFVEVIGEAATRISVSTRNSAPEIPWREIIAMRNRLVHGYFAVDLDILWSVAHNDIPALTDALDDLISRVSSPQ